MPSEPTSISLLDALLRQEQALVVQEPAWYREVCEKINDLILNDMDALLQLLYRMDVSEEKLRNLLRTNAGTDAAPTIARLMMERQLEKIAARKQWKPTQQADIPEDEKW